MLNEREIPAICEVVGHVENHRLAPSISIIPITLLE